MSGVGNMVCVTGATGYLASWLIKHLLARGYTVRATVRSLGNPKKLEHLLALDGAEERLSLFEANLTTEGSFDSAVNGCVCVFHMASPISFTVIDPQVELIDPAVKGTLNVLKSAAKVPTLKRVVLTSSTAAVLYGKKFPESGDMVDETWFSDPVICGQLNQWYNVSKTLAEDAAVKFSKENGLDLVILNPGLVIGPLLQPALNTPFERFIKLIKTGEEVFEDGVNVVVDVRDVAIAHILAFENQKANGRYCMVGSAVRSSEIVKIVDKLFPGLSYSQRYKDKNETPPYTVSSAKAEDLGIEFTPIEVSIKDAIESCKEKNLVSF